MFHKVSDASDISLNGLELDTWFLNRSVKYRILTFPFFEFSIVLLHNIS
jgi:hypothetical protein